MDSDALLDFKRRTYQALCDRALDLDIEGDRKLYVSLNDEADDVVRRLRNHIHFSGSASLQLLAGPPGTGKTTGLSRLQRELRGDGYRVVRVDLDGLLDRSVPVDIQGFLILVVGTVEKALAAEHLLDEAARPQGIGDQGGSLGSLVTDVRKRHETILARLRRRHGVDSRLVVSIDSLEHLRCGSSKAEAILQSIEALFLDHARELALPDTHMVLTVPAFLGLRTGHLAAQLVAGQVLTWPAYQVRSASGEETPTVGRMVKLIERRCDWRCLLPNERSLRDIILASGGRLRDLLNMLLESVRLLNGPPAQDVAERVINMGKRGFLPLYRDELEILRRVGFRGSLRNVDRCDRAKLHGFLASGLVLSYDNDTIWYDVHPLVKNDVMLAR